MSKEEFMKQYVLNRALSLSDTSLDGVGAAMEAVKVWNVIRIELEKDKKVGAPFAA